MADTYLFLNTNCLLILVRLQAYLTSQVFGEIFVQKPSFYKALLQICSRISSITWDYKIFASSAILNSVF